MTDWEVIDRKRLDEKDREIQRLRDLLLCAYNEGWTDAMVFDIHDADIGWDKSLTKRALDE